MGMICSRNPQLGGQDSSTSFALKSTDVAPHPATQLARYAPRHACGRRRGPSQACNHVVSLATIKACHTGWCMRIIVSETPDARVC